MENLGPTLLTIHIGDVPVYGVMVDSGTAVNILPLHTMERLGLALLRCSHFILSTLDSRMIKPMGVIDQVPIEVGTTHISIQFVVIDLERQPNFLMLLGQPWLFVGQVVEDWGSHSIQIRGEDGYWVHVQGADGSSPLVVN